MTNSFALFSRRSTYTGFTLSEVVVSMLILGIGLIMLATVFPVAGNWVRQSSEESIGLVIGQTAASAIEARYRADDLGSVGSNLVPIPGLTTVTTASNTSMDTLGVSTIAVADASGISVLSSITISGMDASKADDIDLFQNVNVTSVSGSNVGITPTSGIFRPGTKTISSGQLPWTARFFAAGTVNPWPAPSSGTPPTPPNGIPPTFCWTALVRRQPGQTNGRGGRYDVFILVCKKGEAKHTFGNSSMASTGDVENSTPSPADAGRSPTDPQNSSSPARSYAPYLRRTTLANIPVGVRGIGESSGTVFRKLNVSNDTSLPVSDTSIWYVPAADDADPRSSPLVYVYQTTMAF